MDISDLNAPIALDRNLSQYLKGYLKAPTDFSQANKSFGSMVANPMLFMGPGGQAIDPSQNRATEGTNYLGERAGISQTNMQQKSSFADLLNHVGSNIGDLTNLMTQLQTQSLSGGGGGLTGMFGF